MHRDHASESLQYQPGLSLRKLNRSPQLEVQQTFSKEAGEKEIISQKMFDLFLRMDILVGLLLLIFVNVVLGDKHRIKLEKGYNLQERPASEKEGEPLEIRLGTFTLAEKQRNFLFSSEFKLCVPYI